MTEDAMMEIADVTRSKLTDTFREVQELYVDIEKDEDIFLGAVTGFLAFYFQMLMTAPDEASDMLMDGVKKAEEHYLDERKNNPTPDGSTFGGERHNGSIEEGAGPAPRGRDSEGGLN